MADEKVRKVQQWLNSNYALDVDEDGYTGNKTVTALIKALQTNLGVSVDGSFGPSTVNKFNELFPNGLNVETNPSSQSTKNIIYILRGGMYCRGIDGGDIYSDDAYKFDTSLSNDIIFMKQLLGIDNPSDLTSAIEMKAVLTTDAYTLVSNGDSKVREIQQSLNKKYLSVIDSYLATNGLYERYTNNAIKKAIQYEIGVTADGSWGNGTKNALPALTVGSTQTNLIYLLQYLLYLNGFDPNGFDGSFGNGARTAVKNFQSLMCLTIDGSVGPKTWFALVLSCGDTSRSSNACDTRFEITASRAQILKNAGYEVVGRYINGGNFKELRENELQTIYNAGLKTFFIYQENNRDINDFTYSKGISAGVSASFYARKHKIPSNSIIYFAVDLDVYENQIANYITPYFKGIKDSLEHNFKIGIYGPRLVCQKISDEDLAVSSFVADMSSGYSCNIGQKIPSNWCYDQFKEISNFNNDFDIDKVTYNGSIPATSSIQQGNYVTEISSNESTYTILENLYNYAGQYLQEEQKEDSIYNRNILVLQFFRDIDYNKPEWAFVVQPVDNKWVNYAMQKMNMQSNDRYNVYIYLNNTNHIGLIHMSIVLESLLINHKATLNSEAKSAIEDLSGWAGDLVTMTISLSKNLGNNVPNIDELCNYIGYEIKKYDFDFEDFIQDIDAVNMFQDLYNLKIKDVFKNYYNDQRWRYNTFLSTRSLIGFLPSGISATSSVYDLSYALAYQYLYRSTNTIQGVLSSSFSFLQYGTYNKDIWAAPIAQAFAKKMEALQTAEGSINI